MHLCLSKKKEKNNYTYFPKKNSLFKLIAKTLFDIDIIFKCIMATWMDGFHNFGGWVCCNILVAKECNHQQIIQIQIQITQNASPLRRTKNITLNNNKAFQISHTPKILIN